MKLRLLLALFSLSLLVACSGGSNKSTSNGVTVTPTSANVPINTTQQFSATVPNSTSGVYWSVNDVVGGDLTVGTITTGGLYTAPAVIPSPATVTVKAISAADSTQFASAKVTVTTGTAITITLSPTTASVYTGRTQQFTATFNTTTNTGVSWQVNSVTGGDSTHGTISSTGLYTAPATVPNPATVTITAISQADTSKTATAQVTVVQGTIVNVSPSGINLAAGATQTFTATANNQPINVTWALSCDNTVTGSCSPGTITSAGVYTAPPFPPPNGGGVTITATPVDNAAAVAGTANIKIVISNGSLAGQYAYSFAGTSGGTPYATAGTVSFDGSGSITGGSADLNNGAAASTVSITGGSYHIGTDGRGTATLDTSSGTQNWHIVLRDNTKAFLVRADASATGSGVLYLQDSTKFATGSITGNYAVELAGAPAAPLSSADYAGAITADGAGNFTAGKLDISAGASVSTALDATGSYAAPSSTTGRGTMSISTLSGTQQLAYYVVDGTRALLVDLDTARVVRGEMVAQSAGPFSLATFVGNFATATEGANSQGPLVIGSVLSLDGAGTVTSGVADINSNGNVQNQAGVTGTYALTDAATGRTELSLTIAGQSRKFVFYPQATGVATVLEIDAVQTTAGRAYLQAANAGTSTTFQGSYAARLAGMDFVNSPGEMDAVGVLAPNGGSAITGALDLNDNGAIVRNASVQASYLPSTTASRYTATLTTSAAALSSGHFVFYVIDTNHALLIETDSNRALLGIMEKPY